MKIGRYPTSNRTVFVEINRLKDPEMLMKSLRCIIPIFLGKTIVLNQMKGMGMGQTSVQGLDVLNVTDTSPRLLFSLSVSLLSLLDNKAKATCRLRE